MTAEHKGSTCLAFGSAAAYQRLRKKQKKLQHRILYCCGPLPYYSYSGMSAYRTDYHWYRATRTILEVCRQLALPIDVKLHPTESNYAFHYFTNLVDATHCSEARLVYGVPAESILPAYDLVLFDFLGTAVFPFSLALKASVIIYAEEEHLIKPSALADVHRRCHVAEDRGSLVTILQRYRNGTLPTKWSADFIDRYVYPLSAGDPGINIARYIHKSCTIP